MTAPIAPFLKPFPTVGNNFKVGMKLEAIDPENCSLFCVCSVVAVKGYRLKLHFDGYDKKFDFWVNADSKDIFHPGWCAKNYRDLQPPKFDWDEYVDKKRMRAPVKIFKHLYMNYVPSHNPFRVGMHLEAEDLKCTGLIGVATVADVIDDRVRISFDGCGSYQDILVSIYSPYIRPCIWENSTAKLVLPKNVDETTFNWIDYIRDQGRGEAASEDLFATRAPFVYERNMRLEVVDPKNPSLIRPATVLLQSGYYVKVHFTGWPMHCYTVLDDDSPNIYPIGWCRATGHELEAIPTHRVPNIGSPCPVIGCRGLGNFRNASFNEHFNVNDCPYVNWTTYVNKDRRFTYK